MAEDFWKKIENTAKDVSTLEINTILKSDMVCVKMPENDLLALYEIAKTYNSKLEELGNAYWEIVVNNKDEIYFSDYNKEFNFFRGEKIYQQAGYESFKELRKCAKESISKIEKINEKDILISDEDVKLDKMILTRIEMQSYEICNILRNEKYKIVEQKESESITACKDFCEQERIKLDFRDRQVIQKAFDLGVERVVMQTRIGMDGDIVTRISERFAANPKQFILQIHNESIQMSVSFWQTLFDTLVKFGQTILSKIV